MGGGGGIVRANNVLTVKNYIRMSGKGIVISYYASSAGLLIRADVQMCIGTPNLGVVQQGLGFISLDWDWVGTILRF